MTPIKLPGDLSVLPPLRMSDVVDFLNQADRNSTCPFCKYDGDWDFHIQWPDHSVPPEDDPLMTVFALPMQHSDAEHSCVAITCQNCAHFSMLDVERIKMHILRNIRTQEHGNG